MTYPPVRPVDPHADEKLAAKLRKELEERRARRKEGSLSIEPSASITIDPEEIVWVD